MKISYPEVAMVAISQGCMDFVISSINADVQGNNQAICSVDYLSDQVEEFSSDHVDEIKGAIKHVKQDVGLVWFYCK
jgi:hypothetical protein